MSSNFYTINDLQDVPPKNEPQILTNGGTSLNSNVVHTLDSDDENEEWICIKMIVYTMSIKKTNWNKKRLLLMKLLTLMPMKNLYVVTKNVYSTRISSFLSWF